MIKISVIIPIYNMEQYLRPCLDSVVRQTLEEKEIICVNDGSKDASMSILKEYADLFPSIQIVDQENQGVAYARNNGIRLARGEYVAFLDPDDFYPNYEILSLLYTNAKREKVRICGGSFSSIYYGNIKSVYENGYTFTETKRIQFRDYQWDYGFHRFIYDREMIVSNDIYFPSYRRYQDPPFFLKAMLEAKEFYGMKDVSYRYRLGHQQISWNLEQSKGLLQGLLDNLRRSKENYLWELHQNTWSRYLEYYPKAVKKHVDEKKEEIIDLVYQLNSSIESDILGIPSFIISLTSYPKRIERIHATIQSLLNQVILAEKVILWLAEDEFIEKGLLGKELLDLVGERFEIRWCDDLKPHKKYYYSLLEYPKHCIITVDDDCIYPYDLTMKLLASYKKNPKAVSAMRARRIRFKKDGSLMSYGEWYHGNESAVGIGAIDLLPIGCGGVLYPPNVFHKDIFHKEYILNHCLYTDDLWLKVMHAIQMTVVVLVESYRESQFIEGTQEEALWNRNIQDNDRVMKKLMKDYNSKREDGILLQDIIMGKYGTSINKLREDMERESKETLYSTLEDSKQVLIYGAGFYGKKVYQGLKDRKDIEILCFIVTKVDEKATDEFDQKVISLEELDSSYTNCLILIAMDEKHHKDVQRKLEERGFNRSIAITEELLSSFESDIGDRE